MTLGLLDIFIIFLITIGPLKGMIVYGALTAEADQDFRRKVAIKAVSTATVICVLFAVAGEFLLQIFHVTLPALKFSGGLILLIFAIGMVLGSGGHSEPEAGAAPSTDIAISPIAVPMLATPHGIVAIVTVSAAATSLGQRLGIIAMVLAVEAFNLLVMLNAFRILKYLSPAGLQVIGRIVAILLAALAVQLMIFAFRDLGLIAPVAVGH